MSGPRILAIQQAHAELYRIRLGRKNGNIPERLVNEIRITSPNREVVDKFAKQYGGRAKRWEEQHEVYLPITRLPILLLPGQTLAQTMELWAGQTRQRCCDGVTMCDGSECACGADKPIEQRACKPTSRLTVACPEVEVMGVGRLVTHSVIAAGELPANLSLIQPVLDSGRAVKAVLRIDQLVGPERRYAVPRIEIEGLTFNDLALAARTQLPALTSGVSILALEGGETNGDAPQIGS